jgi:hypothetical protein
MKKAIFALLIVGLMMVTLAFQCGGPPPPPPVGFQIHTMDEQDLFGTLENSPNINVVMNLQEATVNNPAGFTTFFNATTDSDGFYEAVDAVVPANWLFKENNGPCAGKSTVATVGNGATQALDCIAIALALTVTPATFNVARPPTSLQVDGTGILTTHGMPHVQIWSSTGKKMADLVATGVSGGGTILTAPGPNLSGVTTGTYGLEVLNVQADGSLSPVGAAPVSIIAVWIPPSPPPSPCSTAPISSAPTDPNALPECPPSTN